MYVVTKSIEAFPTAKRTYDNDIKARLMCEENITNIIKCCVEKPSFVIKGENTELEFVINGYYFHIVNPDVAYSRKSTHKPLYAHIQIDTSGTLDELNGVDTNGEYTGVLFDDVKGTTANDLYIYDAEGNVPEESKRGTGIETDPITEIHCKNL